MHSGAERAIPRSEAVNYSIVDQFDREGLSLTANLSSKIWSHPAAQFLIWVTLVGGFFFCLQRFVNSDHYLYNFFFGSVEIQFISTAVFWLAVVLLFSKHKALNYELSAVDRLRISALSIPQEKAAQLAGALVPPPERRTKVGLAAYNLCIGFAKGRDGDKSLDSEMSKLRDFIRRNHQFFNVLKQILPLLGFLGTVIGLSAGMVEFGGFSGGETSVDGLRDQLKGFSNELGNAFDTTLLALSYMVILILLGSLVNRREESLLGRIENALRDKVVRRFCDYRSPAQEMAAAMENAAVSIGTRFETVLSQMVTASLSTFEDKMNNGISEVVHRFVGDYQEALSNGTEKVFQRISLENKELGEILSRSLRDSMSEVVQGLHRVETATLRRPRVEIRTFDEQSGN